MQVHGTKEYALATQAVSKNNALLALVKMGENIEYHQTFPLTEHI